MDTPTSMISPSPSTATTTASAITVHASSEVPGKATRRRFTLGYKRKIVTLAAGLPDGELGAMLRREGLYSSHLTHWRRQAEPCLEFIGLLDVIHIASVSTWIRTSILLACVASKTAASKTARISYPIFFARSMHTSTRLSELVSGRTSSSGVT